MYTVKVDMKALIEWAADEEIEDAEGFAKENEGEVMCAIDSAVEHAEWGWQDVLGDAAVRWKNEHQS